MAQTTELATLQKNLESWLAEHDSIMVAYSGGVDSTLLLAVTHRVLSSRGKRIIACIGTSPSNPERELQAALAIAHQLGVNVRVVHTEEFRNPNYIANLADRCYHCKLGLCRQLQAIATAENFSLIIDGNNADDAASDDRPGSLAGQQLGIRSPLVELGITKEQVRTMAKDLNLPNWNKPSTPCTSTRIPYGTPITTAALKQIEFAETALLDMGFKTLRVRHHSGGNGGGGGDIARIELLAADLPRAIELRDPITTAIKSAGYKFVTLDLLPFKSGSLHQLTKKNKRFKE